MRPQYRIVCDHGPDNTVIVAEFEDCRAQPIDYTEIASQREAFGLSTPGRADVFEGPVIRWRRAEDAERITIGDVAHRDGHTWTMHCDVCGRNAPVSEATMARAIDRAGEHMTIVDDRHIFPFSVLCVVLSHLGT